MRNIEGLLSMYLIHGIHICITRTAFILSINRKLTISQPAFYIYSERTQTHAAASILRLKNTKKNRNVKHLFVEKKNEGKAKNRRKKRLL